MHNNDHTAVTLAGHPVTDRQQTCNDDLRTVLDNGTQVYIKPDPIGFLGDRVRVTHPQAPTDIQDREIGLVVPSESGHQIQLPSCEFSLSPQALRAIADLLERGDHG